MNFEEDENEDFWQPVEEDEEIDMPEVPEHWTDRPDHDENGEPNE